MALKETENESGGLDICIEYTDQEQSPPKRSWSDLIPFVIVVLLIVFGIFVNIR